MEAPLSERIARDSRNAHLSLREANRLSLPREYTKPYSVAGVDVFSEGCETLVILAAWRYGMVAEQTNLSATLESQLSAGSNAVKFFREDFAHSDLRGRVNITVNTHLYHNSDWLRRNRYAHISLWADDGWNEEHSTDLPGTMTDSIIETADQFPEKRLVPHDIQFDWTCLLDKNVFDDDQRILSGGSELLAAGDDGHPIGLTVLGLESLRGDARRGTGPPGDGVRSTGRKTAVASDRRNMIGGGSRPITIRKWTHSQRLYMEKLMKVPWPVQERGERRKTRAESSVETGSDDHDDVVKQRMSIPGKV